MEHGEYGAPAATYRQIARGFNRPDYPFAVVLLSVNQDGAILPVTLNLFNARDAWEWWETRLHKGIFYAALFDNAWLERRSGHARLVREHLHGGKWLGPLPP